MVAAVGSGDEDVKAACPRTRFAVIWPLCANGAGKRSTREFPESATHRLPLPSKARPSGAHRPVLPGTPITWPFLVSVVEAG